MIKLRNGPSNFEEIFTATTKVSNKNIMIKNVGVVILLEKIIIVNEYKEYEVCSGVLIKNIAVINSIRIVPDK